MNAETTIVRGGRPLVGATADGAGVRLAGLVLAIPLRVAASPFGRRLAVAATLSLALVGLVTALYAHADGSTGASARRLPAAPAASHQPTTAKAQGGAARPDQVAAAWFAQRQHVAVDRVRALQQRRVSATEIRVMVMALAGPSRLPSAYVTVRRGPAGWAVG